MFRSEEPTEPPSGPWWRPEGYRAPPEEGPHRAARRSLIFSQQRTGSTASEASESREREEHLTASREDEERLGMRNRQTLFSLSFSDISADI